MSKRYDEAIEVTPDRDTHIPLSFMWRGRRYEVDQQLATWREGAEWWQARRGSNGDGRGSNGAGRAPTDRDCFRVLARPAGLYATGELDPDGFMTQAPSAVFDLAFDRIHKVWKLARLWD